MTGEQIPAPSSLDSEDVSITLEHSKVHVCSFQQHSKDWTSSKFIWLSGLYRNKQETQE